MTNGLIDANELIAAVRNPLPEPFHYQYYKGLAENRIVINQEISDDILETAILPLISMDNDPNVEHIEIILNTPGGELYSGFALVAALEQLKTHTTLRIVGMAASMGIYIAMAKNPNLIKICDRFSVGLLHGGSQIVQGSAHAVRDTFKFTERYENKIKDYVLSHTSINEDLYAELERQEYWMDAEDMLKYGIVDKII